MKRTVSDWVAYAQTCSDPEEVTLCIDEAAALATSCADLRGVLGGLETIASIGPGRIADVADRTLEAAKRDREVWGIRDAARVRATHLDDREGARAALEQGIVLLRSPRTDVLGRAAVMLGELPLAFGYEWVLLGEGFIEILQDLPGMRRCLEQGLADARAKNGADDLCAIAVEWAKSLDRREGLELLDEAEALALRNQTARPWTLANAWWSLDEPSAAARVLDGALERSASTGAALHVAQAWAAHGDELRSRKALERASQLAATTDDWLKIAEAIFDRGLGERRLRDALSQAEALAIEAGECARVAAALLEWLHDDAASRRVGPRGLLPEAHRRKVRDLLGWKTSASGLFDGLRRLAIPDALMAIARADYGMDADKHYASLKDICETGLVPRELGWTPGEVLELTRWQSGEKTQHLERGLSCVLLCICSRGTHDLVTDGVILAESATALGLEVAAEAELFFAWLAETTDSRSGEPDDGDPEAAVACLLLFFMRVKSHPSDVRLEDLAARIAAHPAITSGAVRESIGESIRADLWNELLSEILVPIRASLPAVEIVLRALGR